MDKNNLIDQLNKISVAVEPSSSSSGVDLEVVVPKDNLREFTKIIYEQSFMLVYVTAVHVEPELVVIYQFVNPLTQLRLRGRVFAGKDGKVDTISDIFNGAMWYEREIMEFFGLDFDGNEDKRTLILSEDDKGLNPLLKKEGKLKSLEDTGLCKTKNES